MRQRLWKRNIINVLGKDFVRIHIWVSFIIGGEHIPYVECWTHQLYHTKVDDVLQDANFGIWSFSLNNNWFNVQCIVANPRPYDCSNQLPYSPYFDRIMWTGVFKVAAVQAIGVTEGRSYKYFASFFLLPLRIMVDRFIRRSHIVTHGCIKGRNGWTIATKLSRNIEVAVKDLLMKSSKLFCIFSLQLSCQTQSYLPFSGKWMHINKSPHLRWKYRWGNISGKVANNSVNLDFSFHQGESLNQGHCCNIMNRILQVLPA